MLFPLLCLLFLSAQFGSLTAGCNIRGVHLRAEEPRKNLKGADLVEGSLNSVLSLMSTALNAASGESAKRREDSADEVPADVQKKLNEVNRYSQLLSAHLGQRRAAAADADYYSEYNSDYY